jgi:ComF family protein
MINEISQYLRSIFTPFADVLAPGLCLMCELPIEKYRPATSAPMNRRENNHDNTTHASLQSVERFVNSDYICRACLYALPPSPPSRDLLNELIERFPGDNLAIHAAHSCFAAKASDHAGLMKLIHILKYNGVAHIGRDLGRLLAVGIQRELREREPAVLVHGNYSPQSLHAIIPVPIHKARRRERGYNQAEWIAQGVADVLDLPILSTALVRRRNRGSQTMLSGKDRMRNAESAFGPGPQSTALYDKHVLLVDDVLTTGSTVNAVALSALECGARSVSVATVICAR